MSRFKRLLISILPSRPYNKSRFKTKHGSGKFQAVDKCSIWQSLHQGSPTFMQLRATSWDQLTLRAAIVCYTLLKWNLVQFTYYVIINDVNLCDDTHHLNAILKTGPRVTNVVLGGDLVPAGTVLMTPGLHTAAHYVETENLFSAERSVIFWLDNNVRYLLRKSLFVSHGFPSVRCITIVHKQRKHHF